MSRIAPTDLPSYIELPIREKLANVIDIVTPHLPEKQVEAVFVSTNTGEGGPKVLSVWLFTKNLIVDIRGPLRKDRIQFDFARFSKAVDWIRLNARRYDYESPGIDSQLELEFTTTDGLATELSATGEGCTHLMEVYRNRFLANLAYDYGDP